jgi:hypothetical protein
VQATLSLEADTVNQYAAAIAVHNFQRGVHGHSFSPGTWAGCADEAPQFTSYTSDVLAFNIGISNIADREVQALAARFASLCSNMIGSTSTAEADRFALDVINAEVALTGYLGEMVQGGR